MILARHAQHLFVDSSPLTYSLRNYTLIPTPPTHFRVPKVNSFALQKFRSFSTRPADPFRIRAHEFEGAVKKHVFGDFNLDSLLSLLEFACLVSSAIAWIGFAAIGGSTKKGFLVAVGDNRVGVVVVVCGVLMLVGGVAIGAWIRRRQWRRICGGTGTTAVKGGLEVNLVERIERLEEELRSSVTVLRVLLRQIEKLSTRFRVTRQTLKDPIAEAAELAQKNSEATRAVAVQSDILEKELREIQKVLLAMQEQQQKQLDLIFAIGKTTKLWESTR